MLIKNLTDRTQSFRVREITGDNKEYEVFLRGEGVTEIPLVTLVDPNKYVNILEINGAKISKSTEEVAPIQEKKIEPTVVEEKVETKEEPTVVDPDSFVCDICGAEFASARGLASHKNKAHPTE